MSAFHDIWISGNVPMYKRAQHNEWLKRDLYWDSVSDNSKSMMTVTESGEYRMVVLGQFYETVELGKLASQCIRYATGISDKFIDPSGHYIIFLINKADVSVHVFTNRFGTYHAYYLDEGKENAISTYFLGLAKYSAGKKLDWEGITGFLGMGFFPTDKTYLESIKIFKPASLYSFSSDMKLLKSQRYWEWSYNPVAYTVKDAADLIHGALSETLSFSLDGHKVAMPVSGGLDSRMLAGIVNDLKQRSAWTYSYGYASSSPEIKIGKQISEALKLPFNDYVVENYLFDKMDLISDSVDLFQYVDGTRQASILHPLEDMSDVVVGGHWGDVWFDNMHLENYNNTDIYEQYFSRQIIKKGSRWLLDNVCEPHQKSTGIFLKDYFKTELNKYEHIEDPDYRLKAYKTDQWSFRWTVASMRMYQAAVMPVLPFYDNRVVDAFSVIPSAMLTGRKLQIDHIKLHYPSLAAITWQEYDRNLYNYEGFNNRNYIYRILKKMERMAGGEKIITRNWELFYLNKTGKQHLQQALLTTELFSIVSAQKVNELLTSFYEKPTAANGYSISMLHTFAQFLKRLYSYE